MAEKNLPDGEAKPQSPQKPAQQPAPTPHAPPEHYIPPQRPISGAPAPQAAAPKPAPAPTEIIANHTVKEGETLSHLSLKYYGSAYREAWIIIYEANKDVLGGTPEKFVMYPGQVLKIPKRPA